ncbi:hypothetical protein BLNAU_13975 [Blattamonas nauphoetae]|uniref:Uncharacterized protein n=1 Tax=Blattamonas nauphoetae TaxID=2049346 RepID=A0ABQ9XKJ5_9EUKA|nr:hypothetical protein BLNAU_13975 [Blattamonas nauphoetae]
MINSEPFTNRKAQSPDAANAVVIHSAFYEASDTLLEPSSWLIAITLARMVIREENSPNYHPTVTLDRVSSSPPWLLSTTLTESNHCARVNCETAGDLYDSFSTTGVPTLHFFRHGEAAQLCHQNAQKRSDGPFRTPLCLIIKWNEAEQLALFVQNVRDVCVEYTARSVDAASVFSAGPVGLLVGSLFTRVLNVVVYHWGEQQSVRLLVDRPTEHYDQTLEIDLKELYFFDL